ncbi:carboxypeptidase-like regulatory domain-containing protein [Phocaeicola oris]|uniref:carboxypeptidase-like regulatory domain-containing protein n=1 Tax=Phocaeicola oris TaxID=2896850 RepID=UPI00234F2BDA|nr:carboxypeptidase-like regulatory domain-containing protein [Phocaeicola oris]MCE2617369.1 carboxypeptidase-like regulatory domain-containing protein [Phocaeicola oris]
MKKTRKRNHFGSGFLAILFLFISTSLFAQNSTVKGTVTDSKNEPLIGVTVLIQGSTNGTVTDIDGNYTLANVPSDATIEISYVGMKSQTIPVNGQKTINVILKDDAEMLDEVVVVGYSTLNRSQMTTSVSKLDTKVLESASRSNAATALQGTIPGLKVTQTTGQPGSTPRLQLRGGTSWDGAGSPLILIDGVPGSFYALNSDDIESWKF